MSTSAIVKFCPECGARVDGVPPFQCSACATWQWANAKPCAGVLLEYDGKVLLLRRAFDPWLGYWDIPGGFCNGGEHPQQAALRELREETGVEADLVGLLGIWMDTYGPSADPARPPLATLNAYYLARVDELPLLRVDAAEASDHDWFGPDSLPEMGFPNHQPAVVQHWAAIATGQAELAPLTNITP